MMRKYHVRFGGGMMEKECNSHLVSILPYFLTLREKFDEKELEDGLLDHIQKFLLELGAGFSFVGSRKVDTPRSWQSRFFR